jgi:3-dehydroquinate synthase
MSDARTIRVNVAPAAYDVTVRPGLLRSLGSAVRALTSSRKLGLVTDSNLQPLYMETAMASLQSSGFEIIPVVIPAGEEHKNLATISSIYDAILPAAIDRATPLLAFGGGVVGDMTGFAAATLLRGVPFIQFPTTLLAMVDASVGGKTGIDHACGKNLIGMFHQPRAVLIDPEMLITLPERELVGGLAECIKHDIIRDAGHFAMLGEIVPLCLQRNIPALAALIAHNVQIKARVVEADPMEKGERAHLNFGHTFGHAIESVSHFSYSHGEAVGLGMVAAARAAVMLGMLGQADADAIIVAITQAHLPAGALRCDPSQCAAATAFDKKVAGKKVRFVLPDHIGHVVIRDDVPQDVVLRAFGSLI